MKDEGEVKLGVPDMQALIALYTGVSGGLDAMMDLVPSDTEQGRHLKGYHDAFREHEALLEQHRDARMGVAGAKKPDEPLKPEVTQALVQEIADHVKTNKKAIVSASGELGVMAGEACDELVRDAGDLSRRLEGLSTGIIQMPRDADPQELAAMLERERLAAHAPRVGDPLSPPPGNTAPTQILKFPGPKDKKK